MRVYNASLQRNLRRWCATWLFCAAIVSIPLTLWAQTTPSQKAAAEALFDQGLQLLREGKLDDACERFERSQKIDSAVGTLLYLAECYERNGRIASAWATFREAASSAAASGQTERAQVGAERAEKLRPRLSYVTLEVGGNSQLPEFQLTRDEQLVAPATYGAPIPIDPGVHRLTANANGYEPWVLQVQIPAAPINQVVTVPPLVAETAAAPVVTPEPAAPPAATSVEPAPAPVGESKPPSSSGVTSSPWFWVSTGFGVAGLGVGATFGIIAKGHDDDAAEYCNGDRCFDQRGENASKDARSAALISNIGYGVGAVGVISAVVLALTHDDEPETSEQAGWQLEPIITDETAAMSLTGAF